VLLIEAGRLGSGASGGAAGLLLPEAHAGSEPESAVALARAGLYAGLPQVGGLRAAYQWCCFRPRHPDGYPVIDRVPGLDNAWLTSGHYRTGILMAPVTAQIITRWITADQPPPEAADWSAARFA
jgi:glycine oxidase